MTSAGSDVDGQHVADIRADLRAVALGGGHGLAASLSALRHVVRDLTAVVTVADPLVARMGYLMVACAFFKYLLDVQLSQSVKARFPSSPDMVAFIGVFDSVT